ncbi:LEA type 2 family protein [Siphonobacter sp. SORGH_AS_1065]|uniref:NDR1/HIN1-like protein n=1 Tax=Siphonobacter sp. SORGH_AS_1065 TaxID=3041795 RepID=UPI00277F5A24|nr:LEA type 2 family protein [Siphonobacter sp. SORGH_AS_1065]MDQ1090215.1 LEA14-like dessication related protein [Siphonobacter sp. SORGH_AS_1065]
MKKVFITLVILIILAGTGWFLFKRYERKNANPVSGLKPRVEMSLAEISSITDSTMEMSMKMLIDNPLPLGMDIENFVYQVKVDGVQIIESDYMKPLKIEPRDSVTIDIPTELKIDTFSKVAKRGEAAGQDSALYQFEVFLKLAKPVLGHDTLRIEMEKRLPLYHLPEIEVVGIDLEKFKLKKSELNVDLRFINKNDFAIQFKNMRYSIDLGKEKTTINGQSPGVTRVPAKSDKVYQIPVQVELGKMISAGTQMLFQGKKFPFTVHLRSQIISDNDMLKNSKLNMRIRGNMEDMKAAKKMVEMK